jgi:hypothetical protein
MHIALHVARYESIIIIITITNCTFHNGNQNMNFDNKVIYNYSIRLHAKQLW